ncbi:hypothetical protein RYZ26_06660 [Terasakiella sp. A23]|uniref:hypothetical protein n=1 Tax=Terasakiella sp. FCG-A23 TaxID=3080561 RepID=UPI002952E339|nr:hypothetical protein [Terasakiella sp. A23]MDV7339267.1 hypothetical protein [Terasakiella sp. A23]
MKRKTLIISAVGAAALIGATTLAFAKGPDRGWCQKDGEGYGKGQMMKGHHGGMGFGMMGGRHMGRFMKDGNYDLKLTPERVKDIIEGKIAMMGNENLKVGDITTDEAGQIIAKLVTKDNSLVETFTVDPKTGAHRPLR